MKRIWLVAALAAGGCWEGSSHSSPAGGSSETAVLAPSEIVLGCPRFRPTTLDQIVVASGALDADAYGDIVAARRLSGQGTLYFFKGTSDGAFAAAGSVELGAISGWPIVRIQDVTGDGRADLVIADPTGSTTGKILLCAQNADGTFAAPTTLVAAAHPVDAEAVPGAVLVLERSGGIGSLRRVASGGTEQLALPLDYTAIAPCDDLAAVKAGSDTVHLLRVGATVEITSSVTIPGGYITDVRAGEVNGDARPDLAIRVSYPSSGWIEYVKIFRNDGGGAFTEIATAGFGGWIREVTLADTSGDGKDDVFVAENKGGWDYVAVSYSNAAGGLAAPLRLIEGYWSSIFAGNFDGAGAEDLVVGDRFFFRGGDNPDAVRKFNLGDGPRAVAIGDFNADGRADLAAFLYPDGRLAVALGTGPWTFGTPTYKTVNLWWPEGAAAGDVSGDGKLDLIVRDSDEIYILYGNGLGGFSMPFSIGAGHGFVLADLGGDGFPEVVFADMWSNVVRVYRDMDGTTTAIAVPGGPRALTAADFNGDARTDLAVVSYFSRELRLILNDPVYGLGLTFPVALPNTPWLVAAGDFNGDLKQDVVVTRDGDGFTLLRGNGAGGFGAPESFASPRYDAIVAHDFNADGKTDLAGLTAAESLLNLHEGAASPFAVRHHYPAAWYSWSLALADVDGDGKKDVAAGNEAESGAGDPILIWKNLTLP